MISTYRNRAARFLVAAALLVSGLALAADAKQPVGKVSIEETQFGLILGGSKGGGVLTFEGKEHHFKLMGLSAGLNIGVSKMSATGDVYDLKQIGQFPGTYTKLDASVALGGGLGGLRLKNENGVIMTLHSRTAGADLNLGTVSGVTVTMEK
jgi:opacity protein-like surface antigen